MLSGNRNFEGRVHALTRANYLASPPLVVAYALAGTVCMSDIIVFVLFGQSSKSDFHISLKKINHLTHLNVIILKILGFFF